MKKFLSEISENIFEKDFILWVLAPLAVTMAFGFFVFMMKPFILLLALIAFACMFLITNYQKRQLEKSLFYEDENTNPMRQIREEVNEQLRIEEAQEEAEVYEDEGPGLKDKLFSKFRRKEEEYYEEVPEEVEEAEPVKYFEESEKVEPAQKPAEEAVQRPARRGNEGLKRKVSSVRKKEVPVKQEIDYNSGSEFEFGNFDE